MKLQEFLSKLATDADALAKFRREPDIMMEELKLLESDRRAIAEGDARKLRRLLFAESTARDTTSEFEVSQVPPTVSPPPDLTPPAEVSPPMVEPTLEVEFPIPMVEAPEEKPHEEPHEPSQYEGPPQEEQVIEIIEADALRSSLAPVSLRDPGRLWNAGGLTVVGTGIRGGLQTTPEARVCITQASKVLYLLADPISENWIHELNATAESMEAFYQKGKRRLEAYEAMVEKILTCLQEKGDVCAVFYGHPGVFSYPAREAIRRARLKGFDARMLPGISTEDNLIADLGIDPGPSGLQSYEVTTFLLYRYRFDTSVGLILWQVGVLGEILWDPPHEAVRGRLPILADYLIGYYGHDHEVVLYHASQLPCAQPTIERLPLSELPKAKLVSLCTMYIPPKGRAKFDPEMAKKLGMKW